MRPAAARACKKRWNGAAPSTRPSPPWAIIRGRFLAAIHVLTDTAVVSSANSEALAEEWTRHGLVQHMDVVLGQDAGTKEACLSALSAKGYAPGHVLMVGDALGDLAAAQHADALFYPILVGKEKTSWERLVSEALPRFLAGTFAGAYQEQLLAEQREILK